MTISYSDIVATCRGFGNFHRLLRRWRGSIYKLVWRDMAVFITLYAAISLFYRFYIRKQSDPHSGPHKTFISIKQYCAQYQESIPLGFVLGFYVSSVVTKWTQVFKMIPWPDNIATLCSTYLLGNDERGRIMRRTIMRYINLSFVLSLQLISTAVKRRFPTEDHLIEAGFLLPHEQVLFARLEYKCKYPFLFYVPLGWAGGILARARREGRWPDDMSMNTIIWQLDKFRSGVGDILVSDWLTMPLMYTQVVTLAIYLYFLAALFGHQFVEDGGIDLYVPLFTIIQFFFYMGWLKVAETMVVPWGEDDDDWDVQWFIDRHLQTSYLIADEMQGSSPAMGKDKYWDETGAIEIPYTELSLNRGNEAFQGSQSSYAELRLGVSSSTLTGGYGFASTRTKVKVQVMEEHAPAKMHTATLGSEAKLDMDDGHKKHQKLNTTDEFWIKKHVNRH